MFDRLGGGHVCWALAGTRAVAETSHINLLELQAVRNSLFHFAPLLRNEDVVVQSDSRVPVAYINRQGGVPSSPSGHGGVIMGREASALSSHPSHPRSPQRLCRPSLSGRADDWKLHHSVLARIWSLFGQAEEDLFASWSNHQCPPVVLPADAERSAAGGRRVRVQPLAEQVALCFSSAVCHAPSFGQSASGGVDAVSGGPGQPGGPLVSSDGDTLGRSRTTRRRRHRPGG